MVRLPFFLLEEKVAIGFIPGSTALPENIHDQSDHEGEDDQRDDRKGTGNWMEMSVPVSIVIQWREYTG